MWKAALITTIAAGAFAFGVIQTATTTFDGRNDPCEAIAEACAEPTEPATTSTTTTAPATTAVPATTLPPTTVP